MLSLIEAFLPSPLDLHAFWGLATLVVCGIGLIATGHRAFYFGRRPGEMNRRLTKVFLSDSTLYLITLAFGVATMFHWKLDGILYPTRIALLILNIWCAIRLTRRFPEA